MELYPTQSSNSHAQAFAHRLRAKHYDEVEQAIFDGLTRFPSPFSEPGLRLAPDDVDIQGWDDLYGAVVRCDRERADNGGCAALGLDFVNADSGPNLDIGLRATLLPPLPPLEPTQIMRWLAAASPPKELFEWRSQPLGRAKLDVTGLSKVAAVQREVRGASEFKRLDEADPAVVGRFLVDWLILLRVHQAIERGLAVHPMPREMPVIVGVEHEPRPMESNTVDYGPKFDAVHASVADPDAEARVRAISHQQATDELREWTDELTAAIVGADLRRAAIKVWPEGHEPEQRASFVHFAEIAERAWRRSAGMPPDKPSWEMDDAEFKAFTLAIRGVQRPAWEGPPVPKRIPEKRRKTDEAVLLVAELWGGEAVNAALASEMRLLAEGTHFLQQ